jgi:DNA segregation ATPase FtsK/SpoIIIE-like protein
MEVWADLLTESLHIGLYGQSGAGKDTFLRCWFATLCQRASPNELQFAFIDGKGDWLIPQLASLAHMFAPPAGGYGAEGDTAILAMVKLVDAEAARRQALIIAAGCTSREAYVRKTGKQLPLLVVVATDVMTSVAGDVEALLVNLISKARSLGIRVIVSMQTPTGRDTRWRSNLATVLAGSLQSGSQDQPALGVPIDAMPYRPSQLPPPRQRPGVFVARFRGEIILLQAPWLDDDDFEAICDQLPRSVSHTGMPEKGGSAPNISVSNTDIPDTDEEQRIAEYILEGLSANKIYDRIGGNRNEKLKVIAQVKDLLNKQGLAINS